MKTPREILLQRHQPAQPKLDRIRREVISGLNTAPAVAVKVRAALKPGPWGGFATLGDCLANLPRQLWRELIWPCRRTWAGLAATWLVLLAFNRAQGDRPLTLASNRALPSAEVRLAFRDQHRVLEEILGPAATSSPIPASPHPRPPKPRSAIPGPGIG